MLLPRQLATTIVLEGGLGNRMRVAAAAYTMCERLGLPMRVLWTEQWGMHCRYDQLFMPCKMDNGQWSMVNRFEMRDAQGMERWLYARARGANLYLPRLAQRLLYRNIILSPQIAILNKAGFDYDEWFRRGSNLMFAYRHCCEWKPELLGRLFVPTPDITEATDQLCASFTSHTIGCHIRRTDNQESIASSPTELFTAALDHECELNPDTHIFLATDDEHTKKLFHQRFGSSRLTYQTSKPTRNNATGIQDALVEMLALSRTSHVYGTAGSTFSEIATLWSGIPLTILKIAQTQKETK